MSATSSLATDSVDLSPDRSRRCQSGVVQRSYTILRATRRAQRETTSIGAKRAMAVRNYLAQNGINAQRIRTISYGKERPVAVCNDISCWSQNRRAQTVLNSRADARS
jgi:peptidoglycan-associated lipoprotein